MSELHLVTGGNGYVGSFIARELLRRGCAVRVLDLQIDPKTDPRIEARRADVLDAKAVDDAMRGVDCVHHTAALVPLKKAGDRFWQVNVEGTRTALEAAKRAGVKHFSHMSSSAVFGAIGDDDCPIDADTPLEPVEIYGRSKLAGERIVAEEMEKADGLSCSIIRPRTIIGTERLGIFEILFEWIKEGRNIYLIGDGSNLFQFVHIDDLIEVSIRSALKRKKGYFNAGTDRFGTLAEDLGELCRRAGTGSRIKGLPVRLTIGALFALDKLGLSPLAPWHYLTYHKPFYFDLAACVKELDWKPKHSNREMLWSSYQWYLENKDRLKDFGGASAHRSRLRQGILALLKRFS